MTSPRPIGIAMLLVALVLNGCGSGSPRFTTRERSETHEGVAHQLEGIASYYAEEFHGRKTANGETFDMNEMTAAHRSLPFGTRVSVTNRETGKSVMVRINDRGPFKDDRVIDLSLAAARALGLIATGTGPVVIEVLEWGSGTK